ncbi:MAG: hypothetical protein ABUK01_05185 [Leptospirales bacterium]
MKNIGIYLTIESILLFILNLIFNFIILMVMVFANLISFLSDLVGSLCETFLFWKSDTSGSTVSEGEISFFVFVVFLILIYQLYHIVSCIAFLRSKTWPVLPIIVNQYLTLVAVTFIIVAIVREAILPYGGTGHSEEFKVGIIFTIGFILFGMLKVYIARRFSKELAGVK